MESTKERIIKSAISLFAEKGFHETKVEEISERSGVAKGTIYLYFKSKEEIMASCLEFIFSEAAKNYEVPENLNFYESVKTVVEKNFKFAEENIDFYRMLFKGVYNLRKETNKQRLNCSKELFEKVINSMEKIILKGIEEGKIKGNVPKRYLAVTFTNTIISSITMIVNSKINSYELYDFDENEYKNQLIDFLTGGIYEK